MPSIPSSKRQIKEQVFQRPGTSTQGPKVGSFDGSATANMNKALTGVQKVYGDYRDKVDKSELDGFKTRLRDKQNQLTHNPETGFLNVRGKDTLLQSDDYNKEYEDFAKAEIDALGSDRAKDAATLMAADIGVGYNKQLMAHTNKEMEQHDNEQTKANLSSLKNTAILNYQTDPSGIPKAVKEQEVIFREFADRKGMSKKEADLMVKEGESDLLGGVIYQVIADDKDMLAEQLFKDARKKGKFVAEDLLKLERAVDQSSLLGESQRQTSIIMGEGLSETEALAMARRIEDPKLKRETVRKVSLRYGEGKRIQESQRKESFESLALQSDDVGLDAVKKDPRWLDLNLSHRNAIEARARQKALGITPKTDMKVYAKLNLLASQPATYDEFLGSTLLEYEHKLSPAHFTKFSDLQRSMRKGNMDGAKGIFTIQQATNKQMDVLEIKDKEKRATFGLLVDEAVLQWSVDRQGKKPTTKEIEEISKDLAAEIPVDDGFLGSGWFVKKVPKYALTTEQSGNLPVRESIYAAKVKEGIIVPGVPQADSDNIVEIYKDSNNGRLPKADEILKRYKRVRLGQ